jgi:hypothetical protein
MIRPDNVQRIDWIKYNVRTSTDTTDRYAYVTILPLAQFLEQIDDLNTTETNIGSFTQNSITFYYRNDVAPCYCTIVDDVYIIFDAYDSAVESTLQTGKTKCFANTIPTFSLVDTAIPDLDDQQFPLLLNEATSVAFVDLKQMPNEKAEQESRRQWRTLERTKALTRVPSPFDALPHFGRKF